MVLAVLDSGCLAAGDFINRFETAFASFVGTRFAVATSSGTTALHVALLAAGIQPGDRVITTPFTFVATANAILHCGAIPVFADIDPETLNIDPEAVYRLARTSGAKALIPVHLFGTPCHMDALVSIATETGLLLFEDCAQAHGAKYQGQTVGSFGQAAAFSFYATKNMTTGEGGMVVTNQEEVYRRAQLLINHGAPSKYCHELLGYNYRLTEVAAAIGLAQLAKLPDFTARRQANAKYLTKSLADLPWLILPKEPNGRDCVYHQYTIRTAQRDALASHLMKNGVQCGIHYPVPIHRQPLYNHLGYGTVNLPVAELASRQVLSLPVHPGLTEPDLARIIEVIGSFNEELIHGSR